MPERDWIATLSLCYVMFDVCKKYTEWTNFQLLGKTNFMIKFLDSKRLKEIKGDLLKGIVCIAVFIVIVKT